MSTYIIQETLSAATLNSMAEIHVHLPYRHHRVFSQSELIEIELRRRSDLLSTPGSLSATLIAGKDIAGYCYCSPLGWDTRHFEIGMARIEWAFPNPALEEANLALLNNVLSRARQTGIQHISASLDADDYDSFRLLSKAGFSLMDSKLTYVARKGKSSRRENGVAIRNYLPSDHEAVTQLVTKLDFPSRFSRDSALSRSKTSKMYSDWVKNIYRSCALGGILVVACRQDKIVACGGVSPIGSHSCLTRGNRLLGNSILACSEQGVGSAYSIVANVINKGLDNYTAIEFSTSINNRAMLRVLEAHECKLASATHALRLLF